MMKKTTIIMAAAMMGIMMTACGEKTANEPTIVEDVVEKPTIKETVTEETTAAEETKPEETQEAVQTETTEAAQTETALAEETQPAAEERSYEDNFAVDSQAASAYGEKIKSAVAEKNLEALADLTAFPVYVGFKDNGTVVNSKEDFLALDVEKIFTAEMVEAMTAADTTNLKPSMAGFVLNPNGLPDIIFGVTEGRLAIKGINY